MGQEFTAFRFFNKKGNTAKTTRMVKDLAQYDVILFGENHNNAMNHWLQLKLTQALYDIKKQQLVLGAEMFERDNQAGIDAYLNQRLEAKNLKDSVRLWTNYETDYRPLLDFAKEKRLMFVATNIPRRYASQVSKQGLESLNELPPKDKTYIANLPITVTLETPGYPEMKKMMGSHADDMKVFNFISAQAIKDATMAESILKVWQPGTLFLHYNGNYHSKEYGGIYWYLKKSKPDLKVAVISVFESENPQVDLPKESILTEYNLVIPSDMTKTY